ncbi:MAG: hydrogenase expression/formation protein [Gammaproteobacteria bacterium]|nr:hydrogenase expression/formation protein [Gammaproteobacteria bacterium]MDX5374439.1 hydrogenase expression/formation protein [Gammaproteobacteria bacterium]
MSGLADIGVKVESGGFVPDDVLTGMADAVLREIHQNLEALRERGETHVIDLASLPLTGADRRQLREALGQGEVTVQVEAAGPTAIHETAYAGVWWVEYQNLLGATAIEQVEIAPVPAMLPAHADDIAGAATRLAAALEGNNPAD